jgi:hypothetical protein
MAPSSEVPNSSEHDSFVTEMTGAELIEHRSQLMATLEALCLNPIFRNSPKSCEFIRHVVHRTLEGNIDELKERLIGMSLLGRDASYDTSTDSGVRVRANDVRKRLIKFNEGEGAGQEFSFVLPPGTYVPRFFRNAVAVTHPVQTALEAMPFHSVHDVIPHEDVMQHIDVIHDALVERSPGTDIPLSLFQLAVPAVVAIFLCIICMRWQLSQEDLFTNFWKEIFQGDYAFLYLAPSHVDGKQGMVAIQELNEATPLLDLIGQFHRKFTVISDLKAASVSNQISVYVGLNYTGEIRSFNAGEVEQERRFHLVGEGGDRVVVDGRNPARSAIHDAALLTIVNGRERSMYIDGTDDKAIRSLVNRLCDQTSFPAALADSVHSDTITQAVFPVETYAKGILDQQPLTRAMAALELPR